MSSVPNIQPVRPVQPLPLIETTSPPMAAQQPIPPQCRKATVNEPELISGIAIAKNVADPTDGSEDRDLPRRPSQRKNSLYDSDKGRRGRINKSTVVSGMTIDMNDFEPTNPTQDDMRQRNVLQRESRRATLDNGSDRKDGKKNRDTVIFGRAIDKDEFEPTDGAESNENFSRKKYDGKRDSRVRKKSSAMIDGRKNKGTVVSGMTIDMYNFDPTDGTEEEGDFQLKYPSDYRGIDRDGRRWSNDGRRPMNDAHDQDNYERRRSTMRDDEFDQDRNSVKYERGCSRMRDDEFDDRDQRKYLGVRNRRRSVDRSGQGSRSGSKSRNDARHEEFEEEHRRSRRGSDDDTDRPFRKTSPCDSCVTFNTPPVDRRDPCQPELRPHRDYSETNEPPSTPRPVVRRRSSGKPTTDGEKKRPVFNQQMQHTIHHHYHRPKNRSMDWKSTQTSSQKLDFTSDHDMVKHDGRQRILSSAAEKREPKAASAWTAKTSADKGREDLPARMPRKSVEKRRENARLRTPRKSRNEGGRSRSRGEVEERTGRRESSVRGDSRSDSRGCRYRSPLVNSIDAESEGRNERARSVSPVSQNGGFLLESVSARSTRLEIHYSI